MTEKKKVLIVDDGSMSGGVPAAILEMENKANIEIEVISPDQAKDVMPQRPTLKDLPIYPLTFHPLGPELSGREKRRLRRKQQRKKK